MDFAFVRIRFTSLRATLTSVVLGLCLSGSAQASGLYVFHLSGHTVIASPLLAGKVTLGDPYSLYVGFEISNSDLSPNPKVFTSVTPEANWHLTIGNNFSRTFAAGTRFALAEQSFGIQLLAIRNLHAITLGGVEFPADSVEALRISGIALEEPYPADYRLGTVLSADFNAAGNFFSRFTWGEFPDPAFQGTIERVSLAPEYVFSSVPESSFFAFGGLALAAVGAMIRLRNSQARGRRSRSVFPQGPANDPPDPSERSLH